jgi:hypothetical protein
MIDLLKYGIVFTAILAINVLLFSAAVWVAANIIKSVFS